MLGGNSIALRRLVRGRAGTQKDRHELLENNFGVDYRLGVVIGQVWRVFAVVLEMLILTSISGARCIEFTRGSRS